MPPVDESDVSDLCHPTPIGESDRDNTYKNLFGVCPD
jgi:hypothetical protein